MGRRGSFLPITVVMSWWRRSEYSCCSCGDGETYFVACCVESTAVVVGAPVPFSCGRVLRARFL
ncbi:unnamed protein product [Ectocarpus sp. 12 AP-2014]